LVNARLTAHGKVPSPPNPERYDATPRTLGTTRGSEASPRIAQDDAGSTRAVWIDGAFVEVPIFGRSTLRTGTRVDGPAIIEEYDSTTYLAPTWSLTVEDGLLALQKAEPAT
jgi:N-methylhydantoinase A/oxoprolinase/acetone carboxylase beta subunit